MKRGGKSYSGRGNSMCKSLKTRIIVSTRTERSSMELECG